LMTFASHHAEYATRFDLWPVTDYAGATMATDVYIHRFWVDAYGEVEVEHHMAKVLRRFNLAGLTPQLAALIRTEARRYCDQAEEAYYQIRARLAARAPEETT